jgi:hypothetical protein
MAKRKESGSKGEGGGLAAAAEKVVSLVGWVKTLLETLSVRLEKTLEKQVRRVLLHALWASLMAVGLAFTVLGVLYLVIDLAGVPRGVVFTVGGVLLFLPAWVAWLLMRK